MNIVMIYDLFCAWIPLLAISTFWAPKLMPIRGTDIEERGGGNSTATF